MFLINGQPMALDTAFSVEGTQYPANWLRLASEEERASLGITEVISQERPDDRFYWVSENSDGSFSTTPKDLDTLKANLISQVKATAGSLLAATDWKVIRASETAFPLDVSTLNARAAIRRRSNELEATIEAYSSVPQLQTIEFTWPED